MVLLSIRRNSMDSLSYLSDFIRNFSVKLAEFDNYSTKLLDEA
jgi:hypothetical protein